MALWRQIRHGLHVLFHRSAVDREIAEEVEHFLEESAAAHEARGLSPEEARRAARREVGNPMAVREEIRGYGWENAVENLLADLRYAGRRLRGTPGFTAVTVLTLAVGIGGTTAIFGAVRPILFDPLPYPDADRLTMVWDLGPDGARYPGTFGMFSELAQRARSFEALAALKPWQPALDGRDRPELRPERLDGLRVTAGYFDALGVAPALGRGFEPSEDRPGAPEAVVLSHGLWQRRFGGDPGILGRPVSLDETPHVVVGVMPAGFDDLLSPSAELWAPLRYDLSQGRAWGHHLRVVGRLSPGVGPDRARDEIDRIGQAVVDERHPTTYGREADFSVVPLHDEVIREVEPALLAVLAAVILVLAIACVNVTNLLLARSIHRRGELALRTALGAPVRRLVRQLLTESLLLAGLGGLVGMALAVLGLNALLASSPPALPRVEEVGVDGGLFACGIVLTTLIGVVFGSIPAVRTVRRAAGGAVQPGLEHASDRTTASHRRTRGMLVVAEVALALVLLVSAGLLLRSVQRLLDVPPGFDPSGLLTMQIQASGHRFDDDATTRRYFDRLLEAVRAVPGVTEAALTSQVPLSGDQDLYGVHFEPSPTEDPGEERGSFRYAVSPGYFETMGVPVRRGRLLDERDREGTPRVAVISESLAKRRLPGLDPIGRRLRIGTGPLYTVVGVVGDVKQESLALDATEAVYTTAAQWRFADPTMSVVLRPREDAGAVMPAVRRAIWSVDEHQAIARVVTMDELLAASAAERRFVLILFEAFALAALLLAAAGIYGVLSGSVAERTHEIGVRSVLGATRRSILGLVAREGFTFLGLGVALGTVGSLAAGRAIAAMLFGVSPLDPPTYLGVLVVLTVTTALASGAPAWRAARIDPVRTLREE